MQHNRKHMDNFKGDFLHPQIPDFQLVVSWPNIVQTIHQWKAYLFSFQGMSKSQF